MLSPFWRTNLDNPSGRTARSEPAPKAIPSTIATGWKRCQTEVKCKNLGALGYCLGGSYLVALRSTKNPADSSEVTQNPNEPDIDVNGEYSELVQKSYDELFEPWLNPDEDQLEDEQQPELSD